MCIRDRPGSVRTTMQVALFRSAIGPDSVGSAWCRIDAGSERGKDRIKMLDDGFFATDHQAITTFHPRNATAGAHIHMMHPMLLQFSRAPNIVTVIGVAAIDDDVTRFEQRY